MPGGVFGATFVPTQENQTEQRQMGGGTYESPIQVLNFRLPKVTGAASANAISPLVSDARRPTFGSAVLESVLRTILGPEAASELIAGQAQADQPPSQPSQAPSPFGAAPRDVGSELLSVLSGLSNGPSGNGSGALASLPEPEAPRFSVDNPLPGPPSDYVRELTSNAPDAMRPSEDEIGRINKMAYDRARGSVPSWMVPSGAFGSGY